MRIWSDRFTLLLSLSISRDVEFENIFVCDVEFGIGSWVSTWVLRMFVSSWDVSRWIMSILLFVVMETPLPPLIPTFCCHKDVVASLPADGLTVVKKSSSLTWNCGDTVPVVMLRTRDTVRAWRGENSKLIPSLAREFQWGMGDSPINRPSSAYTGHPKLWKSLRLHCTGTDEKRSSLDDPFFVGNVVEDIVYMSQCITP